jgi:hypothetical protein
MAAIARIVDFNPLLFPLFYHQPAVFQKKGCAVVHGHHRFNHKSSQIFFSGFSFILFSAILTAVAVICESHAAVRESLCLATSGNSISYFYENSRNHLLYRPW